MADAEFREGDIDIQFLDRRTDLLAPSLSDGAGRWRSRSRPRSRRTRPARCGARWSQGTECPPLRTGSSQARAGGTAVSAVRILRLAAGGDGVGRLEDGRTVFVPRTAPGDLVELTRVREHRRFARARVGAGAGACAGAGGAALSSLRGRRLRRLSASAHRLVRAARGPPHLRGRRAPSHRQARRSRSRARAGLRGLRVPHQDHARTWTTADGGSACTRSTGPTTSSSWLAATSPDPS